MVLPGYVSAVQITDVIKTVLPENPFGEVTSLASFAVGDYRPVTWNLSQAAAKFLQGYVDRRRYGSGGDFGRRGGQSVTAWQYGGGLAYDITGGDVRPVVILGAGGATWSGAGRTETDFELRFGAGLKILFGRVGARVDVIDHLVLDHFLSGKSEHDIQVTGGFLVGF